jgi:hypothetical protein
MKQSQKSKCFGGKKSGMANWETGAQAGSWGAITVHEPGANGEKSIQQKNHGS